MFYKGLLLIILSLAFGIGNAADDSFDKAVEGLIYEKIDDPRVIIDIQYESKDKTEKIRSKYNNAQSLLLINFDPTSANFKVRVNYNSGASEELFGRYISSIEVPIISKFIKAGDIITANDITLVKTKINKIKGDYITNENDIIGMQAKKVLANGSLIKRSELRNPLVIKINDPVNILYYSNNIRLKTSGTALGSGSVGDMIKVKNEDTGAVLLGQIINKNTVQVGTNDE